MRALERVLEPFQHLKIVLSTSWVDVFDFSRAKARLPAGLQARIVGATYHRRHTPHWHHLSRYAQIIEDVQRRKLGNHWLAVDDNAEGWALKHRNNLVHAKSDTGLRAVDLALIARRLEELSKVVPGQLP